MRAKNRTIRIWQIAFLLLLVIGTVLIIRQQRNLPYQHNEGFVFGTVYHVTYQHNKDLQENIEAEMKKVDDALSTFNKNSILSNVNQNEPVELNDMFKDVFNMAEQISKETDGAFDITVAPMVNAWGFGFKKGTPPTKHVVDSLKSLVGYQKVRLESGRIVKQDSRIMLDCSAIAKGYGVDVVANYLKKEGIENFIVEIGGEVVSSGISEKRLPWKIGVTKPVDDSIRQDQELQTILNVTNKAMATSGNYRNFYYKNGKKYAHTIDPKTGYPVQHGILSATVLADQCAVADAYATSFMVMGLDKTKEILKKHPELMVYIIYADSRGNNKIWYSPSMKDKIEE
ncbi:ApbE family protein [Hallella bergensis DSM 17361]|uniref:FAD:protein FMN transferase n=1 Tax=Hallella bergensis DSM 17361 TaxID=585502 RepID=D1PY44_9BACT|nr:FAD:protein FMN transferase [Hallella bergensis]EFA43717.1 ApbE family protein [Hallella bergensis DSM 17361]